VSVRAEDWGCPYCGGDLYSRPTEPMRWLCSECGRELVVVRIDVEDEFQALQLESAIANLTAAWWLRARRRAAFFVGHRLGLVQLGYALDYNRDRYRGL
jgi:hypothetical protein